LKAFENNAGYRGSKSVICKNIAVKEQRVYGSLCGNFTINQENRTLPYLRCTLMGFERNYQVKFPSYLIIKRQFYGWAKPQATTKLNITLRAAELPQHYCEP
jgi:hypothetical protein